MMFVLIRDQFLSRIMNVFFYCIWWESKIIFTSLHNNKGLIHNLPLINHAMFLIANRAFD